MHQAAPHEDLSHPGTERGLATEVGELREDLHQGVLEQILGGGPVGNEPADQRKRRAGKQPIQRVLSRCLACACPAQQRGVSFDVRQSAHMS